MGCSNWSGNRNWGIVFMTEIHYGAFVETAYNHFLHGVGENAQLFVGRFREFQNVYVDPHGPSSDGKYTTTPWGNYIRQKTSSGFGTPDALLQNFQAHMVTPNGMLRWGEYYGVFTMESHIEEMVSHKMAQLRRDLVDEERQFLSRMRRANSVQSSTCVVGLAGLEKRRIVKMAEFQHLVRTAGMVAATEFAMRSLRWETDLMQIHRSLNSNIYAAQLEFDRQDLTAKVSDRMWNLALYEDLVQGVGALTNPEKPVRLPGEPFKLPQWAKSTLGALSGAVTGYQLGDWVGAIIGLVVGLALSFV